DIAGRTDPGVSLGRGRHRRRTSAPVEQVGRRWTRCGYLGREPEVGENLPNDDGVLDGGDHAHATATAMMPAREDKTHKGPRTLPRSSLTAHLHGRTFARSFRSPRR